ncbi:MAG: hypothetical protein WD424_09125 [Paenibacillaceae bacterium]
MNRIMLWAICILILGTQIAGCSSFNTIVKGNELSYVKKKLELGMNKAEVKKLFGRSYTSVQHAVDGNEVWRFDWVTEEGYVVIPEAGIEAVAHYDRSGYLTGKLSAQLFVGWTQDNVVKDVKVYYIADGKIHEYHILEDGQTGEVSL